MNIQKFDFSLIFIFLVLTEIIGQKMMIPFFYKFGLTFMKTSYRKNVIINHELNKTIIKSEGKYKFTSKGECIFTSKIQLSSSIFFRMDIIPISKNICHIHGNKIEIISKFPLILSIYVLYSIILLFVELFRKTNCDIFDYIFPFISVIIFIIIYFIELNRLSLMKKELKELLDN